MLILAGLLSAAYADGLHAGIPVRGVEGLGEPEFLTPQIGWSAPIEGGFVRVFVGQSAEEAAAWVQQAQMAITVRLPALSELGDEAWGDETGLLILRDGNVALQVRAQGNARAVAETMLAAMPDEATPWPQPPALEDVDGGRWRVEAPDAIRVQFFGGAVDHAATELTFTERPGTVVAWDAWGRPAVLAAQ